MSAKTTSASSTTRSSTSRTRKTTSSRTKAARIADTSTSETPADKAPQEVTEAPKAKKTTTRRRSTAKATAKKADDASASLASNDTSLEETPQKRAPRRKTTKAETSPAAEKDTPKPVVKRTRRKSKTAETTAEETAVDSPEDALVDATPKATRRKTSGTKTTRTRRKKSDDSAVETTADTAPIPSAIEGDTPQDAAEDAEKAPAKKRATRRRSPRKTDNTPASETAISTATDSSNISEETSADTEESAPPKRRQTRRKPKTNSVQATESDTPTVEASEEIISDATVSAPENDPKPLFTELALSAPILKAVEEMGYSHPTPIQAQAIPEILAGHDVLGVAQTGTGKTASFTLPLLEKLSKSRARARMPRSLILEPTRELALQVAENFERYGAHLRLTHALLIGGGSMNEQRDLLNRGVDVLIATPGRLLDMFERGGLLLTQTDLLVIDEADRMLDMGFIPDIERIVSLLSRRRQTLFFSATMAPEIRRLADNFLKAPKEITVARQSSVATTITEGLLIVERRAKNSALKALLQRDDVQNAIVFCNRKRDVDILQRYLTRQNFAVGHLHGDLTQSLRFETLERFRSGELKILVCSDVAARGIDIGGLSHVFNYDLPFNAEDYVHRIGRTGRAGKEGTAYSFASPDEQNLLEAVEKLTDKKIAPITLEGFPSLTWQSDSDDTATSSDKKRSHDHRGNQNKRNANKKQADREQELLPEARKHDHRRSGRAELLPPVPEKNGIQDGFGEHVPAFMKVSFLPGPRDTSEQ